MVTTPLPTSASAPGQLTSRFKRARGSFQELWRARHLTASLVARDLKARHRGSFLGLLWSLVTPLLLVGIYYFVFKLVFNVSAARDVARPDGHDVPFAVYFFCGLVLWNLFSTSVTAAATSVTGSGYLINKVYFPRAILPLSTVLSSVVTFGFELLVLAAMILVLVGFPNLQLLWMPVVVMVVVLLAYGLAVFVAAVTVMLRDVAHFIGVLMQLWFWGTPIIYSMVFVADRPDLARVLELNPMTGAVVSFRNVVLLNHAPDFALLAYSAAFAVLALFVGFFTFQRWQRLFPEII